MKKKLSNRLIILFSLGLMIACNLPTGASISATQSQDTQTPANLELSTEVPIDATAELPGLDGTPNPQGGSSPIDVPQPEPGDTMSWVDGSTLVYIPPGEFLMGLGAEDDPEHEVYLDGFWIYRTEVTNSMYSRCVAMGKCSPPAIDPSLPDLEDPEAADSPVVGIRWDQAENYCQSISGTLPTEAQWERTARGSDSNPYPWGSQEPNCRLLNFNDCLGEISPVLEYPMGAAQYDVLDMAGNVFEWAADWYAADYYANSPHNNPTGPAFGEVRSVRGSTFKTGLEQIESALRYFLGPDEYRPDLGFRCVVEFAHQYAPPCEVLSYVPSDEMADNPDEPPGGSAACVVPQPEISVITYCDEGKRGNNISWTPADADMDYSLHAGAWCTMYDADTLACVGKLGDAVDVKVCKSCPPPIVELGVPGTCDPPYVMDESAGLCQYDGPPVPGREVCTPGSSLNSEGTCCEIRDGTPLDFPICPVGGRFDDISKICWFLLPSTGDQKCDSQTVFFDECPLPTKDKPHNVDPCAQYSHEECRIHINECYWDINTIPEVCRSRP
jgi:formylglycine-generating enzyme required for sulfatase activity